MYKKMLVPLDGSSLAECVLPHVVAVAKALDARVTLLRVLEHAQITDRLQSVDPLGWHIRKAEAEADLEGVRSRLQESGLRAQSVLLEGHAAERIIEYAHENGVDLIILSSHGRSGLSGWNVSSIVFKIILWDNFIAMSFGGPSNVAYTAHLSGYAAGFGVAMGMLLIRGLPRDQFDLLALWKRWHQRRVFADAMRDPTTAARAQYGRVARPIVVKEVGGRAVTDPNQDRVESLRGQIAECLDRPLSNPRIRIF